MNDRNLPVGMDSSQMGKFQTCAEAYRLTYVQRLRKIRDEQLEISLPLTWGQAVHAGLEVYYKGGAMKDVFEAADTAYQVPIAMNEKLYTITNARRLLSEYPAYAMERESGWKTLGVEQLIEIELEDATGPWIGKIDLVVETEGGIWGVDHKTTGKSLNHMFWSQFEPNTQITGYTEAIERKYGQCSGMIINALSIGWLSKPKLLDVNDPEADMYSEKEIRYSKYYKEEKAYCSGFRWQGQQQMFNRTREQREDWKGNVKKVEQRKFWNVHMYGLDSQWEKNERACGWCEFRDLCIGCGDEQIKDVMYETYDPFEYLKEIKNG